MTNLVHVWSTEHGARGQSAALSGTSHDHAPANIRPGQQAFWLATDGCPRQDSNLRSRLRRALLCTALTSPYVLNGAPGARMGRGDASFSRTTVLRQ